MKTANDLARLTTALQDGIRSVASVEDAKDMCDRAKDMCKGMRDDAVRYFKATIVVAEVPIIILAEQLDNKIGV